MYKFLAESKLVFRAEAIPDLVDSLFQLSGRKGLERQPFILHFLPQNLNPIQFRTIGR